MANPNPKHKFTSTNQPCKTKSYRTRLIEALKAANDPMTETEFLTYYINEAMSSEPAQAVAMLREIFLRINPVPKPVSPTVDFDFPANGTPVEKINAIANGIASGVVPVDVGKQMAEIIKTGLDVQEVTELAARLERLEKLLEQKQA